MVNETCPKKGNFPVKNRMRLLSEICDEYRLCNDVRDELIFHPTNLVFQKQFALFKAGYL